MRNVSNIYAVSMAVVDLSKNIELIVDLKYFAIYMYSWNIHDISVLVSLEKRTPSKQASEIFFLQA